MGMKCLMLKDTTPCPGEDQTHNLTIKSPTLSQLSYQRLPLAFVVEETREPRKTKHSDIGQGPNTLQHAYNQDLTRATVGVLPLGYADPPILQLKDLS